MNIDDNLKFDSEKQEFPDQTFWDLAGQKITKNSFTEDRKKLLDKLTKYEKNPKAPFRNLILCLIPILAFFGILFLFPGILDLFSSSDNDSAGYIFILPFIPAVAYSAYIFSIQRDLVKILIAKENNWIYSPNKNSYRWKDLSQKYPEFFKKGDKNQNLQDEFWGNFEWKENRINFHTGIFEYTTVEGTRKKRRNVKHEYTFFGVKLKKILKADFRLVPENVFIKIFNVFRKKEIDTESTEFCKSFAVFYNGKKDEKALEIVKTLSPALQIKILEMKEKEKSFSLMFRGDAAIFIFKGKLLKKMRTNFFRKVKIDERDTENIKNRLGKILEISTEMSKYLD